MSVQMESGRVMIAHVGDHRPHIFGPLSGEKSHRREAITFTVAFPPFIPIGTNEAQNHRLVL